MSIDPSTAFVSYSREDLEFALRLAKDLKAKGAKVWMDKLDIRPGQRWEAEVETALDGCLRMLVILSPASIASKNVLAEAGFAIDEGKEVIPVLYRDCKVPFRLRPLQYADFRSGYGSGLDELFVTLSGGQEAAAAEQERLQKERDATEQARLKPIGLEGKEEEEKEEEGTAGATAPRGSRSCRGGTTDRTGAADLHRRDGAFRPRSPSGSRFFRCRARPALHAGEAGHCGRRHRARGLARLLGVRSFS